MKIITVPIVNSRIPNFLGILCHEGDKNSARLEFTGAEAGAAYKLDMCSYDGTKNVMDLANRNGTLVLELDGSVQLPSGRYEVQLRTVGEKVIHSNVAYLTVLSSINAVDSFPAAIPTEMAQLEQRMTSTANHPPMPGANGCWLLWDAAFGVYRQSDLKMQEPCVFVAEYGVTDYETLLDAWNAGKVIFCRAGEYFSCLYRHKEGTYFSFKTATSSDIVTRSCYPSGWNSGREPLAADRIDALTERVAALEAKL